MGERDMRDVEERERGGGRERERRGRERERERESVCEGGGGVCVWSLLLPLPRRCLRLSRVLPSPSFFFLVVLPVRVRPCASQRCWANNSVYSCPCRATSRLGSHCVHVQRHVFFAKKKADSTLRSSQAVPHPSTNRALRCLTSEVERDPVHSTRYGRRRQCRVSRLFGQATQTTGGSRAERCARPAEQPHVGPKPA